MARSLSANMQTEVVAKMLSPIFLVKAEFDSGNINLWTGIGNIVFNGDTYVGAGSLIGMTSVVEATNIEANGVNFTLRAIPSDLISIALSENYQGRFVSCYFGCLNGASLITDPYLLFKGRADVLEITDAGSTSTLTMRCENLLIDLRRKKTRRYTDEDQKVYYPDDFGLEFVDSLQDREIFWGKASPM